MTQSTPISDIFSAMTAKTAAANIVAGAVAEVQAAHYRELRRQLPEESAEIIASMTNTSTTSILDFITEIVESIGKYAPAIAEAAGTIVKIIETSGAK